MKKISLLLLTLASVAWSEVSVIAVSGQAEKAMDPNMVTFQVEIWARAAQAKVAQEAVAKEYQRIKGLVEKFKVKKEDFETQAYNLSPEYNYEKGTNKMIGYKASHMVSLISHKIEDAGALVDALSSQMRSDTGGVNISSINWDFDKRDQIETSLLAEAVKSAKSQADELAKASGSKIKGVYRLSRMTEGLGPIPGARMMVKSMAGSAEMASTEIAAGPVKVKVQVQVEYQIQ